MCILKRLKYVVSSTFKREMQKISRSLFREILRRNTNFIQIRKMQKFPEIFENVRRNGETRSKNPREGGVEPLQKIRNSRKILKIAKGPFSREGKKCRIYKDIYQEINSDNGINRYSCSRGDPVECGGAIMFVSGNDARRWYHGWYLPSQQKSREDPARGVINVRTSQKSVFRARPSCMLRRKDDSRVGIARDTIYNSPFADNYCDSATFIQWPSPLPLSWSTDQSSPPDYRSY